MTTLLEPSGGQGLIDGFDIRRNAAEVRKRIGYVSQMISVDGTLTGISIIWERDLGLLQKFNYPHPADSAGRR